MSNEDTSGYGEAIKNRRAYEQQLADADWRAKVGELDAHGRLKRRIDAIEQFLQASKITDADGRPFAPGE
jgi:hypothetical protein